MEDIQELVEKLIAYNNAYRSGEPLVSDTVYDALVERLRKMDPGNPFLNRVEPEAFEGKVEVRHPAPMLSTEKAYSKEQLQRFLSRVRKEAAEIGIDDVRFRVTPKLDGVAARDDGTVFASRGNGEVGYEISSAFIKGVDPKGGRGGGVGEIVIVKSYFESHLAEDFEHPRNMVVGIVSSDILNARAQQALEDRVVHFVPYTTMNGWEGSAEELLDQVDELMEHLIKETDYPTDGLVVEVTNEDVKAHMGATAHHYRWQIAIKTKGDTAATEVLDVTWQVGRTGNVTPVMEVVPVSLSGATIRRVTAHNAGLILKRRIGSGAKIEIIRSGEVIPKLERVLKQANHVSRPDRCRSCGTHLEWNRDFLRCTNDRCPAQTMLAISHWFKTLGNTDWFGIKTIERLVRGGFDSLEKIYPMSVQDFVLLGFGPVQSENLFEALATSRTKAVDDWRFLAAFGLPHLGVGDGRKLLKSIPLEMLLTARKAQIEKVPGFGELTSRVLAEELTLRSKEISGMQAKFKLMRTAPGAVDFIITLRILDGIDSSGRGKEKEKRELQQTVAAKLLAGRQLSDLIKLSVNDVQGLLHGIELPSAVAESIVENVFDCSADLATAAGLDVDWIYPQPNSFEELKYSPISGKAIVFTGKMVHGSREAMQAGARRLGAKVQLGVSGKTDFLVCGGKVGPSKIEKAKSLGIKIISEADYLKMISETDG